MNELLQLSKGWRLRIAAVAVPGLLSVGLAMLFIYASKLVVDIASGAADGAFWPMACLLVALLLLQIALTPVSRVLSVGLQNRITVSLRARLYDSLVLSRWRQTERFASGDVQARLAKDVDEVAAALGSSIPGLVRTAFELALATAFLLWLQPWLAVAVLVASPLFLLAGRRWHRHISRLTRRIKSTESAVYAFVGESVEHRTVLKTLEAVPRQRARLASMQSRLSRLVGRRIAHSTRTRTAVQLMFSAGYLTAFIWGAAGIRTGAVSFGALTAFLQLVGRVQGPLLGLARSMPSFSSTAFAARRVLELLRLEGEPATDAPLLEGELTVRIEDVTAGYEVKHPVLEGLSAEFRPDTFTAVMGPTGAGKTTLIRLLLGLIAPYEGEVRIEASAGVQAVGSNAASAVVSPQTRRYFAYAPQECALLSGSIRDNLLLARPDATDEELRAALRTAMAQFVFDLPHGLATRLDEHGGGLSQGQLQRLNIARTLLRQAPVVILDEPTSALDAATERALFANLKKALASRTVILITHRAELANACDTVCRL